VYSAARASCSISSNGSAWIVAGPDGTDTLLNISNVQFTDVTITLPIVQSVSGATDNHFTHVGVGHLITINLKLSEAMTVTGSPTLQLMNNATAVYASGSGTSTLTFTYTVQVGDDTSDLQVTGINLPSGATIKDGQALNLPTRGVTS